MKNATVKNTVFACAITFAAAFGFVVAANQEAQAVCGCCSIPSCPQTQGHRIIPDKCTSQCIYTGTHACDVPGECT